MEIILHFLTFGNLILFPLSFVFKWSRVVKILLAIVFVLQLFIIGAWWLEWVRLVRIDNQDRLHFLIFLPIIGILSFIASIIIIGFSALRNQKKVKLT